MTTFKMGLAWTRDPRAISSMGSCWLDAGGARLAAQKRGNVARFSKCVPWTIWRWRQFFFDGRQNFFYDGRQTNFSRWTTILFFFNGQQTIFSWRTANNFFMTDSKKLFCHDGRQKRFLPWRTAKHFFHDGISYERFCRDSVLVWFTK